MYHFFHAPQEAYHIDLNVVDEYAIAQTGITPGPGLIVMVEANEGKLDNVKAAVEQIKADKVGSAFYPEERDAAELSQVEVAPRVVGVHPWSVNTCL